MSTTQIIILAFAGIHARNTGFTTHGTSDFKKLGRLLPQRSILTHSSQQKVGLGIGQFAIYKSGYLHSYCVIHTLLAWVPRTLVTG